MVLRDNYFESMQYLRNTLLACDNIWDVVEVLTNDTGAECGKHLEKLLMQQNTSVIREDRKYQESKIQEGRV